MQQKISPWIALVLATLGTVAFGQQAPVNLTGTWLLSTKSFSATLLITQTGTTFSGQFAFSAGACVTSTPVSGGLNTLLGSNLEIYASPLPTPGTSPPNLLYFV